MSKTKEARRAAAARRKAAAADARYFILTQVDWMGSHPAIVRAADGLMVPCSHSAPRGAQAGVPLPANWAQDGDCTPGWARATEADRYGRMPGCVRRPVSAALEALADKAFAMANA
jgi:hypothetical protein